jgi:hypothetical protein
MNKLAISKFAPFFILGFIVIANLGCDSISDNKTNYQKSAKITNKLTSLGSGTTDDALHFELKCKTEGSKLYWILETMQTVYDMGGFCDFSGLDASETSVEDRMALLRIAGVDGFSGQDASQMAEKIIKEFRAPAENLTPKNKIRIEFLDCDGFTITKATTSDISDVDADGKSADPLHQGWYYRGVIDLSPVSIGKVTNFQLRGDFSENMRALIKEAGVLVRKKKMGIGN